MYQRPRCNPSFPMQREKRESRNMVNIERIDRDHDIAEDFFCHIAGLVVKFAIHAPFILCERAGYAMNKSVLAGVMTVAKIIIYISDFNIQNLNRKFRNMIFSHNSCVQSQGTLMKFFCQFTL